MFFVHIVKVDELKCYLDPAMTLKISYFVSYRRKSVIIGQFGMI